MNTRTFCLRLPNRLKNISLLQNDYKIKSISLSQNDYKIVTHHKLCITLQTWVPQSMVTRNNNTLIQKYFFLNKWVLCFNLCVCVYVFLSACGATMQIVIYISCGNACTNCFRILDEFIKKKLFDNILQLGGCIFLIR